MCNYTLVTTRGLSRKSSGNPRENLDPFWSSSNPIVVRGTPARAVSRCVKSGQGLSLYAHSDDLKEVTARRTARGFRPTRQGASIAKGQISFHTKRSLVNTNCTSLNRHHSKPPGYCTEVLGGRVENKISQQGSSQNER